MTAPPYRWEPIEHTADAGVRVEAATREALFAGAAAALADTIGDVGTIARKVRRRVELTAGDEGILLVAFLNELLFLFETEGLLFAEADVVLRDAPAGGLTLAAELVGEVYDLDTHELRTPLKAVTYHGLSVGRVDDDGWRAEIIFDV